MKRNLVKFTAHGFALCLLAIGFASCQRTSLDVAQANFQAEAEARLSRLTSTYGRAFAPAFRSGRGAYSGTGYDYQIPGLGFPQGTTQSNYTYSYPYNLSQQNVQFQSSPQLAVQQCHAIQEQIPKEAETFPFAMITLARCLNRFIHDRNTALTWMYQQGNQNGQGMWNYSMNYGSMVPYNQYPQNNYSPLNQFAYNGWAQ